MKNIVAVGIQWGDEGKGKMVDVLAPHVDVVARFQGGPNAGHTLVVGAQKIVLHHIPSGILHQGVQCLIGNGTILEAHGIVEEMDSLLEAGFTLQGRLFISERTHLIMPYHIALDKAREVKKGKAKIGTTGCGIGPTYEDKAARRGIRLIDLCARDIENRLQHNLDYYNFMLREYYQAAEVDMQEVQASIALLRERVLSFSADVSAMLYQAEQQGKRLLFEGAQGLMLDTDHGTYPFVTSSNTVAGSAMAGLGVGAQSATDILGIAKAYCTRVGSGPFPTELFDDKGAFLAEKGHEFGATTGRARRTGWFDAVAVRHAVRVNGLTGLILTKLDVLDGLEEIKLCVSYTLNGKRLDHVPALAEDIDEAQAVYQSFSGWKGSTYGLTTPDDLPAEAQALLDAISALCGCPIVMLSTGPDRDHVMWLADHLK